MSSDARTTQEQLTPDERRSMLRAFADRMLLKISSLDDPEDMPGADRAIRMAASIERIYSRCDRAEKNAPDPNKLEAERARNAADAIKTRVQLTGIHAWGEERRKELGARWDAAGELLKPSVVTPGTEKPGPAPAQSPANPQTPAPAAVQPALAPQTPVEPAPEPQTETQSETPAETFVIPAGLALPPVRYVDYTDIIENAMASGLRLHRDDSAAPP